jgi:hypothetical protein
MSTSVNLAVALPLGLLAAYFGYRQASKHQAQYGKPPWNVAPVMWGVIVFATGLLVGGLLLWAASRADRTGPSATAAPVRRPAFKVDSRPAGGRGGTGSVL